MSISGNILAKIHNLNFTANWVNFYERQEIVLDTTASMRIIGIGKGETNED